MTQFFKNILALGFGLLFGAGLLVSGMANPAKVIGFLDVFGTWDPSLAFVMMGAIGVAIVPFSFAKHQTLTLTGETFSLPTTTIIDARLIVGAVLFGIGWGLVGICPAPAISLVGLGQAQVLYFILPMLMAMFVYDQMTAKI